MILVASISACSPGAHVPQADKAAVITPSPCPIGAGKEVWDVYAAECVLGLFHQSIVLPELGPEYLPGSYQINTPAAPTQLVATYFRRTVSSNLPSRVDVLINPIGTNRFGPLDQSVSVADVAVFPAAPDRENDRERYYWEEGGWWYTLKVTGGKPSEREAALRIVEGIIRAGPSHSGPSEGDLTATAS